MGYTESRTVVLKARGRRAKLHGRPLVVTVGLGFATTGYAGAIYRQPEAYFGILADDGQTSICGPRVSMRWQSHVVGSTESHGEYDRQGPRGFLRPDGRRWVGCYGPEIRAEYHYNGHAKTIARVVALVERARELGSLGRGDCDLLRVITGLQRCGVEVRIHRTDATKLRSVA